MMKRCWITGSLAFLTSACLALPSLRAKDDPGPLRFVARYLLPGEGTGFTDVRWAGDNSVYLSRAMHGVIEMELGTTPIKRRQPIPDARALRPSVKQPPMSERLAVSTKYLATASRSFSLTWRLRERPVNGAVRFEHVTVGNIDDIDLWGDRIIFLGTPLLRSLNPDAQYENEGGIAWLGSLSGRLTDLKPVLYDLTGPALQHYWACSTLSVGAVRFFEDGSFVVIPGYQPGAHLFDASGTLVRSWNGEHTGLTTDCSFMTMEDGLSIRRTIEGTLSWLNERKVLDDVVPLPEGPGLLVRYVGKDKRLHWELRVLRVAGGVRKQALPLESHSLDKRVHADLRKGRLVLLLTSARYLDRDQPALDGELLVAELGGY